MKKWITVGSPMLLTILLSIVPVSAAQAEEVDFSCMSYKVWGKGFVSDRYMESDVVVQNSCPGAVYWSMCIERMDPWTNKIAETHTPSGYVEAEKKARVNLQLTRHSRESGFRDRFQEFYLNISYAINVPAGNVCFASQCEAKKRDLRAEVRANEAAWERAETSMAARIASECHFSGWDQSSDKQCEAAIREADQAEIDQFPAKDLELREKLAAVDPDHCQVWAGELVDKK